MKRYPAYILDLDGTLYRGDEVLDGALETVRQLQDEGATIRYLTNNSTQTREHFTQKLLRMGFPVETDQVYTSALGTAKYLLGQDLRSCYVVGETGLRSTLESQGLKLVEADAEAVVVGLSKTFDYEQMNHAMQLIRGGSKFVATNADATYPMERGRLIPGAGSVVAAIKTCSETEPFVVGKPNPFLIQLILDDAGLRTRDALVVGDRMDTDIESGKAAGCDTLLVMTGICEQVPEGQAYAADLRGLL